MRLSKYLIGTLACALVAGCANEDTPAVDNGTQAQEGSSYMAVNLVMSTDAASRAVTDGGFENGSVDESAVDVTKSVFLFYDNNGNYLTSGNISTSDSDVEENKYLKLTVQGQDGENEIERNSNAVIVLGPTTTQPTQVLAVLNGSSSTLVGMSLTEAMTQIASNGIGTAKGDFIMTNSTYIDGSNKIVTATAISGKTKEVGEEGAAAAIDAAKKDPVKIYVERIAAKLTVKSSVTNNEKDLSEGNVLNNKPANMKVVIDGWCANAINTSSYYIKNLDESWLTTAPFTDWKGTYRTFWAKDANYKGSGTADAETSSGDTYKGLTYYSWKEASTAVDKPIYLHENTIDNTYAKVEGGDNVNVTTALIKAHIEYENDEGKYVASNIYKHNGIYYTEQGLKDVIVTSSKDYYWFYTKDGSKYRDPLKAENITFEFEHPETSTTPGDVTVDITKITAPTIEGVTNIILVEGVTSETKVEDATVIAELKKSGYMNNLIGYKNGACYYQIPIEHLSSTSNNEFYGVVRNHSYVLTISDITGIGGAVYDDGEKLPIIPGKEKNYYMAAQLYILAWQVVEQSAVLN